jgi:hypothetical protein
LAYPGGALGITRPTSMLPEDDPDDTGLPLLRTWPKVYGFVFAVFVLWVVLLAVFSRAFA